MPTPPVNKSLATAVLKDLEKSGDSYAVVGDRHGLSNHAVYRIVKAAKQGGAVSDDDPVGDARKRAERDAQRKEHVNAVKELAFRDFLADLFRAEVRPMPAPVRTKPPAAPKQAHARYPLLHLSDWHFEEVVKAAAVMGLNSYDIPTACRRVYRVVHSFLDWKRDAEAAGRIHFPELTVALNGDFLTGTLHGLERHSDAPNVVRATLWCSRLIASALTDLADAFPAVRVVGTVGNHGRLPDDRKVPTKDPTRSWDYMAYAVAAEVLKADKRLTFDLPESYGAVYEVAGHTVYQGHGNFIQQSLGIVGYGMRRFVSNLASNLGAAGQPLRYAVFGHFHNANSAEFAGVTAFIGPSLIGTQEYGFLSGGSINRPAQQVYVFDRDLGHVSTETLYGDGPGYDGTYEVK